MNVYKYVKTFLRNEKWVWRDAEKNVGINGEITTSAIIWSLLSHPKIIACWRMAGMSEDLSSENEHLML